MGLEPSRMRAVVPQRWYPTVLHSYFEREDAQVRALKACQNFLSGRHWVVEDRLRVRRSSAVNAKAFSGTLPHCTQPELSGALLHLSTSGAQS